MRSLPHAAARADAALAVTALAVTTLAAALLAAGASPVAAQSFEAWGGAAASSPQWGLLGEAPGMNFGQVVLRWTRPAGRPSPGTRPSTEWVVDLIPYARMSPPLVSLRGTNAACHASLCVLKPTPEQERGFFPPGSPVAIGFSPLGVTRRFRTGSRVSPFVGAVGGALLFSERVPTTRAARFNFTASTELGLRIGPPDEPAITIAYRFHHLSNAGTAGENPGVASHLVTVGVQRPRRGTSPDRPRG